MPASSLQKKTRLEGTGRPAASPSASATFYPEHKCINEAATDGTTPMYLVAQDGSIPCMKYLHSVGASCDIKSRDGMLPIHAAAQNGHLDCFGYLIVHGQASMTAEDPTGATPAHYAAGQGHLPVLKWIHARSGLNIKDNLGGTPLHDAAEKGHLHCIRYLIEVANLDVKVKDKMNMAPIDLAEKYGHKTCVEYMKNANSKVLKLKRQRMSNSYSQTFDINTADSAAGASFLHVLKKRPTTSNAAPSSVSTAKGPDVPPLLCRPVDQARPPLLSLAKSSEWDEEDMNITPQPTPDGTEVSRTYTSKSRDDPPVRSMTSAPKRAPGDVYEDVKASDPDAYSKNSANAMLYERSKISDGVLDAARKRTLFLQRSAKVVNGYSSSPSPVGEFDESATERGLKIELSKMIQEAQDRLKPVSSRSQKTVRSSSSQSETPDIVFSPVQFTESYTTTANRNQQELPQRLGTSDSLCNGNTSSPASEQGNNKSITSSSQEETHRKAIGDSVAAANEVIDPPLAFRGPQKTENPEPSSGPAEPPPDATDIHKQGAERPLRERQMIPMPHFGDPTVDNAVTRMDEDTWHTLPDWKKQILRNRIMKQHQAVAEQRKKDDVEREKFAGHPKWKVPILERQESDRLKEEQRYAGMPEWKKNLLRQRQQAYK